MTKTKNNENEHNHTDDDEFCIECYKKHLKEKGVSNEGFWINPDYMTDEDVIIRLEVKREVIQHFDVRVHKDHKEHFNIEEYLKSEEIVGYWKNIPPHELIDDAPEYHRVEEIEKPTGDKVKDDFSHYVCDEGIFYENISSPEEETKKEQNEKEGK